VKRAAAYAVLVPLFVVGLAIYSLHVLVEVGLEAWSWAWGRVAPYAEVA
jgi:hypothetical protein